MVMSAAPADPGAVAEAAVATTATATTAPSEAAPADAPAAEAPAPAPRNRLSRKKDNAPPAGAE
jgi:hypothetical protein